MSDTPRTDRCMINLPGHEDDNIDWVRDHAEDLERENTLLRARIEELEEERDQARDEAISFREDMAHHITEGPCLFGWETTEPKGGE